MVVAGGATRPRGADGSVKAARGHRPAAAAVEGAGCYLSISPNVACFLSFSPCRRGAGVRARRDVHHPAEVPPLLLRLPSLLPPPSPRARLNMPLPCRTCRPPLQTVGYTTLTLTQLYFGSLPPLCHPFPASPPTPPRPPPHPHPPSRLPTYPPRPSSRRRLVLARRIVTKLVVSGGFAGDVPEIGPRTLSQPAM